jgi:hypothetical protein
MNARNHLCARFMLCALLLSASSLCMALGEKSYLTIKAKSDDLTLVDSASHRKLLTWEWL